MPNDLKSLLVQKFPCARCSSSSIGETCRQFNTRIEEHIKKNNKSHIFKHLHSTATYFDSYNCLCFKIIDKTNSKFDLKIKQALHINWRKPKLNAYQNDSHPFTIASVLLAPFCLCFFFFCCFLHFCFIYCFHCIYTNYRHLLLPKLDFVITSSLYNTTCSRLYNNYVINQAIIIMTYINITKFVLIN